ncbi:putative ADP-ribose pyrophosphatase [Xylariaceae sp. FL0016]|nr:putative ADP-ribose pyrophosphatase [Xylariaceae sp. FL0016]
MPTQASAPAAKVISTELLENKDAKWINLVKCAARSHYMASGINYEDQNGTLRTWEAMRRPTRPKTSAVDAVQMLAILEKPTGPELLLEKQFRAPTGRVVIELPAGLVDEGETAEAAALRELREETGYVGEVVPDRSGKRPMFFGSPASSSSTTFMIHIKVDPSKTENQNPKAELEEGEFIEPFWVPFKDLHDKLRRFEAEGYAIDGKLGAFAEGLEMAKTWQQS